MTPEQIEQERTAFEAWLRRWAGEEPSELADIEGEPQYKSTADHQLFTVWLARAEILDFAQSAIGLSPKLKQGLDDTKRLDWLVKNELTPVTGWFFEDKDGSKYEKAVVVKTDLNYIDYMVAAGADVRKAIDRAMQQEKNA